MAAILLGRLSLHGIFFVHQRKQLKAEDHECWKVQVYLSCE
jgi:hypothetical protein